MSRAWRPRKGQWQQQLWRRLLKAGGGGTAQYRVLAAAAGGIVIGFTLARQLQGELPRRREDRSAEPTPESLAHYAHTFGLPAAQDPLLSYAEHVVKWDSRTRTPRFVVERVSSTSITGQAARKEQFKEETALEPRFRNRLRDFKGTGLDRGHLAAAANHKADQAAMDDTFVMSNVAPQLPAFNRGYWQQLERFVRGLAPQFDNVYVITGPLYLPTARLAPAASRKQLQSGGGGDAGAPSERSNRDSALLMEYMVIGTPPAMVHVPNYYFKVVIACRKQAGRVVVAVAAFVLPNQAIEPTTNLRQFLVPLGALEAAAGLKFMPRAQQVFTDAAWQGLDETTAALTVRGTKQLQLPSPPQLLQQPAHDDSAQAGGTRTLRASLLSLATSQHDLVHLCAVVECKVTFIEMQQAVRAIKRAKQAAP
eukprot:TRINITY_DN22893_c0_g1_i1.p1 TRINITY_DN22893_c0_g1~~TRINITY_DN22893_c0_g1_i1.p1  ORF type:complete len:423 (-),score=100.51 TRINITY_DN22893_c0_g1_i1:128-1396(-)